MNQYCNRVNGGKVIIYKLLEGKKAEDLVFCPGSSASCLCDPGVSFHFLESQFPLL